MMPLQEAMLSSQYLSSNMSLKTYTKLKKQLNKITHRVTWQQNSFLSI